MEVAELAYLRRARDLLDREYARPLDVPTMARTALMSPSLFSRRFREAFGDTPYGYLQARRVERAMALLRRGRLSVTDVCLAVGFTSLGSFSSTFARLVGEPPSVYKARDHSRLAPVPPCMTRAWARPGWIAEPCRIGEALPSDRALGSLTCHFPLRTRLCTVPTWTPRWPSTRGSSASRSATTS
jgi:AraC-like DNA-binding protein